MRCRSGKLAQQTNRVFPLLVDENVHYRIPKLLYGAKNQGLNIGANLQYVPVVYGVWHAYRFVVTHTFWVFWPILTYLRKGCYALVLPYCHVQN